MRNKSAWCQWIKRFEEGLCVYRDLLSLRRDSFSPDIFNDRFRHVKPVTNGRMRRSTSPRSHRTILYLHALSFSYLNGSEHGLHSSPF
jgi:hypothetical protein